MHGYFPYSNILFYSYYEVTKKQTFIYSTYFTIKKGDIMTTRRNFLQSTGLLAAATSAAQGALQLPKTVVGHYDMTNWPEIEQLARNLEVNAPNRVRIPRSSFLQNLVYSTFGAVTFRDFSWQLQYGLAKISAQPSSHEGEGKFLLSMNMIHPKDSRLGAETPGLAAVLSYSSENDPASLQVLGRGRTALVDGDLDRAHPYLEMGFTSDYFGSFVNNATQDLNAFFDSRGTRSLRDSPQSKRTTDKGSNWVSGEYHNLKLKPFQEVTYASIIDDLHRVIATRNGNLVTLEPTRQDTMDEVFGDHTAIVATVYKNVNTPGGNIRWNLGKSTQGLFVLPENGRPDSMFYVPLRPGFVDRPLVDVGLPDALNYLSGRREDEIRQNGTTVYTPNDLPVLALDLNSVRSYADRAREAELVRTVSREK